MHPVTIICSLLLAACLSACTPPGPAPSPERDIPSGSFFTSNQTRISVSELTNRLLAADYILVGETHTNPCHHQVQVKVIELLDRAGVQAAVGLEMVPARLQSVLNRFNSGALDQKELAAELNWDKTWGHPFSLYAPVFQAASQAGFPLQALNIDQSVLQKIKKSGLESFSSETDQALPSRIISAPPDQETALHQEYERHQELTNATRTDWETFSLVQAVWDTQMATQSLRAKEAVPGPVLILTGTGHVEYGWGIEHRLHILDAEAEILSLAPWDGGPFPEPDLAEVIYFCPTSHHSRLGFTLRRAQEGFVVTQVEPGSRAAQADIRPKDRIVKAGAQPLDSLWALHTAAMQAAENNAPLVLTIVRDGQKREVSLPLDRKKSDSSPE